MVLEILWSQHLLANSGVALEVSLAQRVTTSIF